MFIDIWDKDNKAIKINKFSKDLLNIEAYNMNLMFIMDLF